MKKCSGISCKQEHDTEFKLCDACRERGRTNARKYKVQIAARDAKRRKESPDKLREQKKAWNQANRGKTQAWANGWRVANPDKKREANWRAQGIKLSFTEYRARVRACGGLCQICNTRKDEDLHVDHCHSTGKIRGLLCGTCNRGIGSLKDSLELAKRAVAYLGLHSPTPRGIIFDSGSDSNHEDRRRLAP